MRVLVLWDIDRTLIDARGVGGRLCASAFAAVTGRVLERLPDMAGRTDRAIMTDALTESGIAPSEALLQEFAAAWVEEYERHAGELRAEARVLPGAVEALRLFEADPEITQSVLTGNMRPTAELKLEVLGLLPYLDLDLGAFGLDALERPALVDIARKRVAGRLGQSFDAASTVLIGDTPNDVLAGRVGGAGVVAVATGRSSVDELRAAGARFVLSGLGDTGALLRAIEELTGA